MDESFFDPEVAYEDTVLPDHAGEVYRGREGVNRAAKRWIEGSEWLLIELEQIVGAGDRLVSIHRLRSKAPHTGIEFETPLAYVWTLRDRKVIHFQSFIDPQRALEAAGLSEKPMSGENVEIVRRALDGFLSAGYDPRKGEDFFELADPDIQYDISRTNPETQVFRGRDGIIEALEQWIGTWDAYEAEPLELIDVAPDRVVTVIRERGRLKGSDAWVEHTRGAVWTIKHQRITRFEEHQDRAKALEAAGLVA